MGDNKRAALVARSSNSSILFLVFNRCEYRLIRLESSRGDHATLRSVKERNVYDEATKAGNSSVPGVMESAFLFRMK